MTRIQQEPGRDSRSRTARLFRTIIVALPLALGTAGVVLLTSSIADPAPAKAWGVGDITGGIKKAAKKVGKTAKKAGKRAVAVGKVAKKAGGVVVGFHDDIVKGTRDTALGVVGTGYSKIQTAVATGVSKARGTYERDKATIKDAEEKTRNAIGGLGQSMDRLVDKAKDKVKDKVQDAMTGSITHVPGNGNIRPGQWGGNAPARSKRTRQDTPLASIAKSGRQTHQRTGAAGRPVGSLRPGVVRDRSASGKIILKRPKLTRDAIIPDMRKKKVRRIIRKNRPVSRNRKLTRDRKLRRDRKITRSKRQWRDRRLSRNRMFKRNRGFRRDERQRNIRQFRRKKSHGFRTRRRRN